MSIQVQVNGVWIPVTQQQLLELVQNRTVNPDTAIIFKGKTISAKQIQGLSFPAPAPVAVPRIDPRGKSKPKKTPQVPPREVPQAPSVAPPREVPTAAPPPPAPAEPPKVIPVNFQAFQTTVFAYIGLAAFAYLPYVPLEIVGLAALASYAVFVYMMLLFWRLIPRHLARTTPNKAAWLSLIPLFNFYWIFVCVWGLAKDLNKTMVERGESIRVHEPLSLLYCIFTIVLVLIDLIIEGKVEAGEGVPGPALLCLLFGFALIKCAAIFNLYQAGKMLTQNTAPTVK